MHLTKKMGPTYAVRARTGEILRFAGFDALVDHVVGKARRAWAGKRPRAWALERMIEDAGYVAAFTTVETTWTTPCGRSDTRRVAVGLLRMEGPDGRPITPWEVASRHWEHIRPKRMDHGYAFRDGPVPGIRKRSWHRGSWMRTPATTGEIREAVARDEDVTDLGLDPRRVGRRRRPPTAWDDVTRSQTRCWKKHRRAQWKECEG